MDDDEDAQHIKIKQNKKKMDKKNYVDAQHVY